MDCLDRSWKALKLKSRPHALPTPFCAEIKRILQYRQEPSRVAGTKEHRRGMGSIGRYLFRATLGALLVVIVTLTALIWVTQALRETELMTTQGQSALVFLRITALIIPSLVLLLAPIALLLAVVYVLNKLSNDSEIIVINASGISPWRLFQPFLAVAAIVSVVVGVLGAYVAPESLRSFRRSTVEVYTQLVTSVLRPGHFLSPQSSVTFHIRERQPDGRLLGVLIDDKRSLTEHVVILAEQGEILKNEHGTFLILQEGTVQRHKTADLDPNIVVFDRYAFELSQFASPISINYSDRERYIWQLIWPDTTDTLRASPPNKIRAELHDRIMATLYPFAFVLIAYAFLGAPRTTRQSRNLSLLGTLGVAIVLRFMGFATTIMAVNMPFIILFQYLLLTTVIGLSVWTIGRGIIIEPPAFVTNAISALVERFAQPKAMA
jgi:lipopolysaccharide export system permease protein